MLLPIRNPLRAAWPAGLHPWLLFFFLTLTLPGFGQNLTWEKQYNGPHSGMDYANKVKSDAEGNVYVASTSELDIVLLKYNPAGEQQWAARYDSLFTNEAKAALHSEDYAYALEVDALGNAYVTGYSLQAYNSCYRSLLVTLKYSPAGVRQWKSELLLDCGESPFPVTGLFSALDGAGHLYRAVSYDDATSLYHLVFQKLTPSASEVWKLTSQGEEAAARVSGLQVDAAANANLISRNFLYRYDQAGVLQWQKQGGASSVSSDAAGNIYVSNGGELRKYNPAGVQQWQVIASQEFDQPNVFSQSKADAQGNVYLTAVSHVNTTQNIRAFALKYSTLGVKQWQKVVGTDPQGQESQARPPLLALDTAANVYVHVSTFFPVSNGGEAMLQKLTPAGSELWNSRRNLAQFEPTDLWVDRAANAYVTGFLAVTNLNYDAITRKFAASAAPSCSASGTIYRQVWTNVPGKLVSSIPLNTNANITGQLTNFNTPAGYGENYGQRILGYICAPATGNYTFFLQGDDQAELYLSTDANPANKVKLLTVQGAQSWVASPKVVSLVAGQRYYVEALHKENTGGDFLRVGWRTPLVAANATPVIVPGTVLSPFVPPIIKKMPLITWNNPADIVAGTALSSSQLNAASNVAGTFTYSPSPGTVLGVGNSQALTVTFTPDDAAHYTSAATSRFINVLAACSASGTIYREVWTNVPGKLLRNIPLNTTPNVTGQLTGFNTPAGYGNNYGQRIRGYICAPVTGSYTFFLQGDDQADLYLSWDASPANKGTLITVQGAQSWVASPTVVSLVAGKRYYIEALHKENTGGDFLRVGWRTPLVAANAAPVIIPGSVLSPFVPSAAREQVSVEAALPTALLKAYPNPSSGTTAVEFTAVENGWLAVQLYNLQGQPLKQLFAEQVEAGSTHQCSLEVSALPAGLYLLRLVNKQHNAIQKLVIVR